MAATKRNFILPSGIGISADNIYVINTTNSSSTSTGSIVSFGGAGIAKSISIGGYLQLFNGANYTAFVSSASGNTVYILPASTPATGTSVLQSTSAGVMSWVPMTATGAASGFTTLNGLTLGIQFFATGTSGTLFNISSSGSTHTFNIPIAGSGSTGLVSTQAQTIAGQKTFTSAIIGDLTGTATTSGFASTSNYSNQSGYGITAGLATTATYSHQAGYAITSGSSGSATTANNLNVVNALTNSAHTLLFSSSATGSGVAVSSNTTLSYNPSSFVLSTSGLAITATTASTSTSNGALQVAGGVGISGRLSFNQASFGTTGISTNPTMSMIGQTGDPIYMTILEDNSISFEGTQGQLFSITPNLSTGYIYSVNDITGIPLLRANANANVTANEYAGNFGIGLTNPGYKLHVLGSVGFTSTTASTSTTTGTLVVSGGVGIGGSLYVASATGISGVTINNGVVTGNLTGTATTAGFATTASYSHQAGYAITSGIATTAQNINVANAITNSAHPIHFSPSATGSGLATSSNTTLSYNPSSLVLSTSGLAVTASTASTNSTSGALVVTGGVGIGGSLYVAGDLTINGTTTTINTVTLTVDDKNIELGSVSVPSDVTAEGGGITLKGTSDKFFNWYTGTGWSSSESLNLINGNTYKIANTSVLSATSLGTGVTNSSLTATGIISSGTWSASGITAKYGGTGYSNYNTGDLLVGLGNTLFKLPVGTQGQLLQAFSSATSGVAWTSIVAPTYGAFYSTQTQTVIGVGISTPIKLNATFESYNTQIYGGAGTSSRIQIQTAGTYNIQFSAQMHLLVGNQPKKGDFWFRINGVDVPQSNTENTISGKDFQTVLALNFISYFNANDYFEIIMSSDDSNFGVEALSGLTSPPRPDIPSMIITVVPVTQIVGSSAGLGVSGIVSLNGLNQYIQYFATGNSGSDFNISSLNQTHTINIPIAGTGATGLLTSQTQTIGGSKTFASPIIGSLTGTATTATNVNVVFASSNGNHPLLFTPTVGSASGVAVSSNSTLVYNAVTDRLSVSGLAVTASTASTSSSTGALIVSGGVGIGGSLFAGTSIAVDTGVFGLSLQRASAGSLGAIYSTGVTPSASNYSFATDGTNLNLNSTSNVYFNISNNNKATLSVNNFNVGINVASTSTTTGAFTVTGGVGIGGSLNVGSATAISGVTINNGIITGSLTGIATTATNVNVIAATTNANHPLIFTPVSGTGSGVAVSTNSTLAYNPSTNNLSVSGMAITSGTASTNTTTGALVVRGGLGVTGQLSFATASFGFTGITTNPTMSFIGATSSSPITLTVLTDNSLSWEGSSGQLFSIDNNLTTGDIFSVSDISGLPIINASAGQTVSINEFGGYTRIGNGSVSSTGASSSAANGSLVVYGGLGVTGEISVGGRLQLFNGTRYTAFVSSSTGNTIYTLPATSPATGSSVLQSTSAGVMSWVSPSGFGISVGGSLDGSVQYKTGSGLGGTRSFFFNTTNYGLRLGNFPGEETTTGNSAALLIEQSIGSFNGSTNGTLIAANASTGFAGDLINLQVNANTKFRVSAAGAIGFSSGITAGGDIVVNSPTAATNSTSGALQIAGGAGIAKTLFVGGNLNLTGTFYTGTNTFTKTQNLGDISLDNGTIDTPAVTFYWANNRNIGIDVYYAGSGTTRFRITKELNESGGAELWSVDRNGIVTQTAWDVGEVINTRVYNNTDLNMSATTTINSTTYTNVATITYTPKSTTSHLWIEFDAHYDFSNGTTTDDFFSRITVGGSAIVEKNQIMVGQIGGGTRSGTIFPISGRYTNTTTSGIAITVQAKWGSADDAIRVYGSTTSGYMRIQEIGR